MFKNKWIWAVPVLALVIVFIFSLTLFPSVQPQLKNLPIAIVNEDQGIEIPDQPTLNMGQTLVDTVQKAAQTEDAAVNWVEVNSAEAVQTGLDNQEYYAALVIPKEFSQKQASLQTSEAVSPEVQIYINQGMNTVASTAAGQILDGVVDNLNNNVRTQILQGIEDQGATLTVEQASKLATPITKNVTNVNEVGSNSANGNSPISLFQPVWMASLASAAVIFLIISKIPVHTRKEQLGMRAGQILMGAVIALVIGFSLTWIAGGMVGLNIPDFLDTAFFLTLTSFSFFLLVTAVVSLVGIRGISVFALLLFFSAPLLALPPEMMSPFYRDWIYSWLPMRFMIEGLRELFFFDSSLTWNSPVAVLVGIGLVSMVVLLATAFKRTSKKEAAPSYGEISTSTPL